jgi:hypothetical protein
MAFVEPGAFCWVGPCAAVSSASTAGGCWAACGEASSVMSPSVWMALCWEDAWAACRGQSLGPFLQPGRTDRRFLVNEIPTDIARFIAANLDSVDQLRVLLLLQANPQLDWRVDEVCRQLYLSIPDAAAHLAKLAERGFASAHKPEAQAREASQGAAPTYRYAPRTEEMAAMGRHIADLDRQRPVTLINLLYSRARTQGQRSGG